MKSAEFDALVSGSNASTATSSGRSGPNAGAKRRNGFPPITRESRRRTRRALLLLLLGLLLLFLGWRFFIRPLLVPDTPDRPPDTRTTRRPSTSTTTSPLTKSTTTTPIAEESRPDIILRPPEMTWNAGTEKPTAEIDSTFDIRADLKPTNQTKQTGSAQQPNGQLHPWILAEAVGQQTGRVPPSITTTRARIVSSTTRRPTSSARPSTTSRTTTKTVEDEEGEDLVWFPHKPKGTKRPPSSPTTQRPSTTTTPRSRSASGGHPHPNAGGGGRNPPTSTVDSDFDLRDVISQVEGKKEIPVWRIVPPGMPPPTAPPKPPEDGGNSSIQVKLSVSATIHTMNAEAKESKMHPSSRHFGDPRRWDNTPVIVTALLDIGRGDWRRYTRPYDLYLSYLENLLRLDNRFIVYCDQVAAEFLKSRMDFDKRRIQLVEIKLSDLPFYRLQKEVTTIMAREQLHWSDEWDLSFKEHPEAMFADYNILVNSKPYFMYNATLISNFTSTFFVWVDAGYGHGSKSVIPEGVWDPELSAGKISLIKITPDQDKPEKYTLEMVYRKKHEVICGGFLAGDVPTIRRFAFFFHKIFMEMLDADRVDDDQTTLLLTIKNYRSDFEIVYGGWFDAFRLFPSRPRRL